MIDSIASCALAAVAAALLCASPTTAAEPANAESPATLFASGVRLFFAGSRDFVSEHVFSLGEVPPARLPTARN